MRVPAAAWGVLWRRWGIGWRIASGVVAVLCLAAAVLSKAVQGPVAALAGLAVLAVAVALERGGRTRRLGLPVIGGAVVLLVAVVAAGIAKGGPTAPIFGRLSFQARQWYREGALTMFRRDPVVGVGLDHHGAHWRQVRSDGATRFLGGTAYTDAARCVPLQMLAQGV